MTTAELSVSIISQPKQLIGVTGKGKESKLLVHTISHGDCSFVQRLPPWERLDGSEYLQNQIRLSVARIISLHMF